MYRRHRHGGLVQLRLRRYTEIGRGPTIAHMLARPALLDSPACNRSGDMSLL